MDLSKIKAIDVHVHAEVSCHDPEDPVMGEFFDAASAYFKAPRERPKIPEIIELYRRELALLGEASEHRRRSFEVWLRIAALLREDEATHAEAIDAYQTTLRLAPNDPDTHNNLGILYVRVGDREQARREFEAACRLDPRDPVPRQNLQRLEAAERRRAVEGKAP